MSMEFSFEYNIQDFITTAVVTIIVMLILKMTE